MQTHSYIYFIHRGDYGPKSELHYDGKFTSRLLSHNALCIVACIHRCYNYGK